MIRACKEGGRLVWLICQASLGRRKGKLLVRGIDGAEWVFCPLTKSIKRGKVSIEVCRGCRHFTRFEQTYIPQMRQTRKTPFLRPITLKTGFHVTRTLNRSKAKGSSARLLPHTPSLMMERRSLVDVFEEEDHLIVLAELPSVDKKDVNIKTDESTITITAENATKKYLEVVRLPARIKRGTVKFTYKNNILQVRLKKLLVQSIN